MWEFMGIEGGEAFYSMMVTGVQVPVRVYRLASQESLVVHIGGSPEDNQILWSSEPQPDDRDIYDMCEEIREDGNIRGV